MNKLCYDNFHDIANYLDRNDLLNLLSICNQTREYIEIFYNKYNIILPTINPLPKDAYISIIIFQKQLNKIKHLTINNDIELIVLPQSLQSLTLGWNFNQPIDHLPQSLQSLTLECNFNEPVDNLPQSLQSLTLGHNFDQPIDNLPQSLQSLTLGHNFDQPIDNLPQSLQSLTLPVKYNLPLDHLPQTIKIIRY